MNGEKQPFRVQMNFRTSQKMKDEFVNLVKNEMNYPSITEFLNTIIRWLADGELVLFNMNKESLVSLKKKIRAQNYTDLADWFREKIREELNNE